MIQLQRGFAALVLSVATVHAGFAVTPPDQVSLNNCQKTVKAEAAKFVKAEVLAIATCLQKLSTELLRNDLVTPDSGAARTCITQFRKLNDTRGLGKSLKEKLTTKIRTKCDPTFGSVAHTIDDITGKGSPGVPVPINTQQLDLWCKTLGGDGSIDTVQEWIDCIVAAHQCEAEQAIAEQYPRASEWLSAVKPVMMAIPTPSADHAKVSDAVQGLTNADTAIDKDGDNKPDLVCPQPPAPPVCSTACCYIETPITIGMTTYYTSCFQYKGSGTEVSSFKSSCGAAHSSPALYNFSASDGACSSSPHGVACSVGSGGNMVLIPTDATCP